MRTVESNRKTTETDIKMKLNLDGTGVYEIKSGCGFLDHMLELFTRHGRFDLTVLCDGDVEVDFHHTVEDIGIVLGRAFLEALGDCRGIKRYGSFLLPMDEALVLVSLDISGRSGYYDGLAIPGYKIGDFDTQLVAEFFAAFCRAAGVTLHVRKLAGNNAHHIVEAAFKGFARAMKEAVSIDESAPDVIPSTKGTIV